MRYDHILWDFNGTIVDDADVGMGATNILLARRGLPIIPSREEYFRLFGFPIVDYYTRLGFNFSKESYDDVANEWIPEYRRLEREAPLREGVFDLLTRFASLGIPQSVLSASEIKLLQEQLFHLKMHHFFEKICGRSDYYGNDKTELALVFSREHPGARVLLIGDTDHDAACAQTAGFDCVLMANGHQSPERLASCSYPVFSSYAALTEYLTKIGAL
ncbi:MAG: HAD family hydrolase [Clostridia bacterium]|nr:HAD family hydrolase [Clostridia bacterium]